MKNITLFVCFIACTNLFSQKLSLTPEGLKDENDSQKTFVVINAQDKSAKQLYDNVVRYITKNYKNPDKAIKGKTDGEYIKFETYVSNICTGRNIVKVSFAAKYTTEINFKDGKIKYEIFDLDIFNPDNNLSVEISGSPAVGWVIYNRKGQLKQEEMKSQIEAYFNAGIKSISDFINYKNLDDKW